MKREIIEIGSILRSARISKNIPLDKVASDVKIMQKYLQALEDEQFSLIPGDVVVKGFLKIYSDYLGVDSAPLVAEYTKRISKNHPIQKRNAPEPVFKGINPLKINRLFFSAGILIAAILIAAALFFAFPVKKSAPPEKINIEKLKIEVEIIEPAWVYASADNRTIFSGMLYTGAKKQWSAKSKISLKIGNAAGVLVRSKSKILLAPGARGKVIKAQFLK